MNSSGGYGTSSSGALGFATSVLTLRRAIFLTLRPWIFILFMVTISRIDFIGCAPPNGGCHSSETAYRKVSDSFILAAGGEDERTLKTGEIFFSTIGEFGVALTAAPPVWLVRMDYPAYCAGYGIFFAPNAPTMLTKTFALSFRSPVLALNVPATEPG